MSPLASICAANQPVRTSLLRARQRAPLILALTCLCVLSLGRVLGQNSPATLPNVRLSSGGYVSAIAIQDDGKILIGGGFTSVNEIARTNLARLNPNGSVDEAWNVAADNTVGQIAISGTDVFVLGDFYAIGGQIRSGLAKLSTTGSGTTDPLWNPAHPGNLHALAVSGTDLFVGGLSYLAKLSTTGSGAADAGWGSQAQPDNNIFTMALDGTNFYVGGNFTTIGGTNRSQLAKLNTLTGTVDPNWTPSVSGGNGVFALTVNGASVFVGGSFTSVSGQSRTHLAKLSTADGAAVEPVWTNDVTGSSVGSLAVSGGDLYVAGSFTGIGGASRTNLARVRASAAGTVDPLWAPNPNDGVHVISVDSSSIYAGGFFTTIRGVTSLAFAKLGSVSGAPDDVFNVQVERPGYVSAIARQADGKVIMGGSFALVGAYGRNNLARFNTDGTVDPSWNPDADGTVLSIVIGGNDIFIAGIFSRIGNSARRFLAKLSAVGPDTPDPLWNPISDPNSIFGFFGLDLLALNGTNLYVASRDTSFFSFINPYLKKLTTIGTGQADPTWNPVTNLSFFPPAQGHFTLLAANDSALFVTGNFYVRSGRGIAKLSVLDGAADPDWNTNSYGFGSSRLLLEGTNLYCDAGGGPNGLFKLGTEGSGQADPLWNPPVAALTYAIGTNTYIQTSATLLGISGTNLYAQGAFTNILGQVITNIVKLHASGAGELDPGWKFPLQSAAPQLGIPFPLTGTFGLSHVSLLPVGRNVYAGAQGFAFFPKAEAPSMIKRSPTEFVVLRNPANGYEVTHFQIVGVTGGVLYKNDGTNRINIGDFISINDGAAGLLFAGTSNGTVSAVSSLNKTTNGIGSESTTLDFGAPQGPVFRFASPSYSISESSNQIRVTVQKWGTGAATVQYATYDGTAVAYDPDSDSGDYLPAGGTLTFPVGETNKSFVVSFVNDDVFTGDRTFWITLTNATGGGRLAYPATGAITIIEDDPFGSVASSTTNQLPESLALTNVGSLQVYLEYLPPAAQGQGQWRLAGELFWRDSGALVSGLIPTNYVVEFKSIPNYYDLLDLSLSVAGGQVTTSTNHYVQSFFPQTGQLTVVIDPPSVAANFLSNLRGQWHLAGETNWHDSGVVISNLNAGGQTVEFKDVSDFVRPLSREVTVHGGAGVVDQIQASYLLLAESTNALRPRVLSFSEVTDPNWPFLYDGQLQTQVGVSSGVVVKERVVLTAAHALFDDRTLAWAADARWFFEEHAGDYQAAGQTPRGWYVIGGYAAQRTNDLATGTSPGYSTSQSQQFDAAALYFLETDAGANTPGRNGYGGYLSSDTGAYNEHLLGAANKFLVGYPLIPGAQSNWGRMHATAPTNAHFTSLNPRIFRTTDLLSYPGNSGGPLYVQWTNGVYYPAGIYLGEGSQTLVRAIDGQVVDLINRAEASGNGGGNFTGGGVITISPNFTASQFATGYVQVVLTPTEAVAAGAQWRVPNRIAFTSDPNVRIPLTGGGTFNIEFRTNVLGFEAPTNSTIDITVDQVYVLHANYTDLRPSLSYRLDEGLRLHAGETGVVYGIAHATSLRSPTNWTLLTNVTLTNSSQLIGGTGTNLNFPQRFFRAFRTP